MRADRMSTIIDTLRQPEYTGENRCIPCTVVNVIIAVVLAAAIVALPLDSAVVISLGTGVFLLATAVIYLRGYLVPGTPWFTKTYLPDWMLRVFDKHPAPPSDGAFDTESFLKHVDAVEECADVNDLCLTPGFRAAWRERIDTLNREDTSRDDLAAIVGVDSEQVEFDEFEEAFVARVDGVRMGQWESHAAFLADVAAAKELRTRYSDWTGLDIERQGSILNGLRLFLEACPSCGGPVAIEGDVVESCCRSIDVVAVNCQDCGARLFEAEQPG